MTKPEEKKVAPPKTPNATGGKKALIPSGNDDISDDPIAQAIQQRMKAGGLTSVVTKTPAVNKTKAPAEKATEVKPDNKQPAAKPIEKKPEAAKDEVKKPAVAKKDAESAATTTDKKPATTVPKTNISKPTTTAKPDEEKKELLKPVVPAKTTTAAKESEHKKVEPKAVSGQSAPKTLKGKKKNEEEAPAVQVEESKEVSIPDDEPVSAQIQNDEKLLLEDETTPSFQHESSPTAINEQPVVIEEPEHAPVE